MTKRRKSSGGWSAIQVTVGLAIVIMVLTWMVSASAYATARYQTQVAEAAEEEGEAAPDYVPRVRLRRASGLAFGVVMVGLFLKNAVVEIPHAPQVVWFACTERILIPIGFVLMMGIVIALGVGLQMAERSLTTPVRTRRSKVPEIRIPKPQDD
jgi:hypothetical protein